MRRLADAERLAQRGRIVQMVDRLGRIAHSLQFSEGLNPAQWEALRYISRANLNSRSPGALASFMGTTRGSVSQTLKALESKKYIERIRDSGDRRSVRLCLTAAGWMILEKDPLHTISEALSHYSRSDREMLLRMMERLLDSVHSHHQIPEFGSCMKCRHFGPEVGQDNNSVGSMCAVSGELVSGPELDRICSDFLRAASKVEA